MSMAVVFLSHSPVRKIEESSERVTKEMGRPGSVAVGAAYVHTLLLEGERNSVIRWVSPADTVAP